MSGVFWKYKWKAASDNGLDFFGLIYFQLYQKALLFYKDIFYKAPRYCNL